MRLREDVADADRQLGPRLQDAKSRFAECQVLVVGVVNESVEHGVVEDLPPVAHVLTFSADPLVGGVNPGVGDLGPGRAVIRPDLEAVVNIFPRPRASAEGEHRDQARRHRGSHGNAETLRARTKEVFDDHGNWSNWHGLWTVSGSDRQQRRFRCA